MDWLYCLVAYYYVPVCLATLPLYVFCLPCLMPSRVIDRSATKTKSRHLERRIRPWSLPFWDVQWQQVCQHSPPCKTLSGVKLYDWGWHRRQLPQSSLAVTPEEAVSGQRWSGRQINAPTDRYLRAESIRIAVALPFVAMQFWSTPAELSIRCGRRRCRCGCLLWFLWLAVAGGATIGSTITFAVKAWRSSLSVYLRQLTINKLFSYLNWCCRCRSYITFQYFIIDSSKSRRQRKLPAMRIIHTFSVYNLTRTAAVIATGKVAAVFSGKSWLLLPLYYELF